MSDTEISVAAPAAETTGSKKTKGPVSDRSKSTLFIRNLPFTATNKDFESFFGEFGPLKACFVVMEHKAMPKKEEDSENVADAEDAPAGKNKGFGFVHYALEDDAMKALESLKTAKFMGRRLKGELAMRKHVKFDSAILAQELPKVHASKASSAPGFNGNQSSLGAPKVYPTNKVEITFLPASDDSKASMAEFTKKQLYKKVRKVAEPVDLVYPVDGDSSKASIVLSSVQDAQRFVKKLDKHIFKGIRMSVNAIEGPKMDRSKMAAGASASSGVVGVKAHRLIVRNLPFSITSQVLDEHFGSFGKILEIVLPTKPGSTALRGFAFVQFEERQAAVLAMAASNGKELAGRTVAVDWAVGKNLYQQIVNQEQQQQEEAKPQDGVLEAQGCSEEEEDFDMYASDDEKEQQVEEAIIPSKKHTSAKEDAEDRTVFVRNISFETSESMIAEKFSQRFGPIEYCKLVVNPGTGASRGTAFIRFQSLNSAQKAVKASSLLSQEAVKATSEFNAGGSAVTTPSADLDELKRKRAGKLFKSVLIDNDAALEDTEQGGILLDGRALSVVPSVNRDQAKALKLVEQTEKTDKRRLGLLQESQIKPMSVVAEKFWSPEDIKERQAVIKARLADLRKNANSVVSESRLSVRHLPTAVTEDHLRQIIDHALAEAMKHSDRLLGDHPVHRENAGKTKPRIKQVKIVRATGEEKESRAGRSKGFGFVELAQPSHAMLLVRFITNEMPDIWYRQLPEIFGRRLKHDNSTSGSSKKNGKTVLAKGKPIVPIIEFAIDKVAVLEKAGLLEGKKEQVHRKHAQRPDSRKAPKRPGFNRPSSSDKKRARK